MEDKIIVRVNPIILKNFRELELSKDKEYEAEKYSEKEYRIKNDNNRIVVYPSTFFEEVKEDFLMVECIDNKEKEKSLTIGKRYPVESETSMEYWIVNDNGEKWDYLKSRFKPIPKEKEIKEYTVQELFEEKEGVKFKIEGLDYIYFVLAGLLRRTIDGISAEIVYLNKAIVEAKFTKVEEPKPVSTVEAFKALEEGKTIMSIVSNIQYKKYDKNIFASTLGCDEFYKSDLIYTNEILSEWLIIE